MYLSFKREIKIFLSAVAQKVASLHVCLYVCTVRFISHECDSWLMITNLNLFLLVEAILACGEVEFVKYFCQITEFEFVKCTFDKLG